MPHLPNTPNFAGCMENVFINGINVIDKAKREDPDIHIPRRVGLYDNSNPLYSNVINLQICSFTQIRLFYVHSLITNTVIRFSVANKVDFLSPSRKRCILPAVTFC